MVTKELAGDQRPEQTAVRSIAVANVRRRNSVPLCETTKYYVSLNEPLRERSQIEKVGTDLRDILAVATQSRSQR
jgi:hypothetical protein